MRIRTRLGHTTAGAWLRRFRDDRFWRTAELYESQSWVFSRTACLGNDVFELGDYGLPRLNIQKGRVDLLTATLDKMPLRRPSMNIYKALRRKDVWPLIEQQFNAKWCLSEAPAFVLLDSYSELTDQAFKERKTAAQFYCNFSDLQTSALPTHGIEALGLLDLTTIEERYRDLFARLQSRWPGVLIFFLHFPTSLETRVLFVERALKIREAVESIASERLDVISIALPEGFAKRPTGTTPELIDFPYHYDHETYICFDRELRGALTRLRSV